MSCESSRQQQLVSEVKHNIAILEDAIRQVEDTKKNLKINGLEVKGQIHSCISRQLEALRNREVWLLNQVETIQHAKEESLRCQLAKLNQCLGSLKNCVTYTQQYMEGLHEDADPKVVERQLLENLNRMALLNLTPEENASLCFRADRNSMRDVIHGFGRIDSRSISMNQERAFTDPTLPSSSLPSPFEDYEDLDHHVLYKTLAELKDQEQKHKVSVPNLTTSTEDWLMKAPTPANTPAETVPDITFPPFNKHSQPSKTTTVKKSDEVQKWLHHVPLGYRSSSISNSSEDDFIMLTHSKTGSDAISTCSNTDEEPEGEENVTMTPYFNKVQSSPNGQWLLDADRIRASYTYGKDYPYAVMKYFREQSNDIKDWLWKYEARKEEEMSLAEKKDCKTSGTCCTSSKSQPQQIEIENLDTLLCVSDGLGKFFKDLPSEKEKWLAPDRRDTKNERKTLENVCIANEKCHLPSECVCDSHCMGLQFNQSEAPYDVYVDWGKSNTSNSDWLRPQGNTVLREEAKESAVFEYFRLVKETKISDWLNNNPSTGSGSTLCLSAQSPMDGYLRDLPKNNSYWLAGHKHEESCAKPNITSNEMTYFDKNSSDMSMWLKAQHSDQNSQTSTLANNCNTMVENLEAFHGEKSASFWLPKDRVEEKDEQMHDSEDTGFSEIFHHDDSEKEKWLLIDNSMDVSDEIETIGIGGKTVEISMADNDGLFPCFHEKNVSNHMWLLNYTN